jgi:hypothetical protein
VTEFIQLTARSGKPLYLRPTAITAVWEVDVAEPPSGVGPGQPRVVPEPRPETHIEAGSPDGSSFGVMEPAAVVVELAEMAERLAETGVRSEDLREEA